MDACQPGKMPHPFWNEQTGCTIVNFPLNKLNGKVVVPNAPQKRIDVVCEMIAKNGSITIAEFAQRLKVSRDTIKRDLKKMGFAWIGASKNGYWTRKSPKSGY